jgi:hypothetical protein
MKPKEERMRKIGVCFAAMIIIISAGILKTSAGKGNNAKREVEATMDRLEKAHNDIDVMIASGPTSPNTMKPTDDISRFGEKLVRQLWADIKSNNMAAVGKKTAFGFQSIHQDGARTREQELALIKKLELGEYTLSDFKVSQNGPVIIATYFVSVGETIDGTRLSAKPAARLSAFLKTDSGWQWIAHANLKPLN